MANGVRESVGNTMAMNMSGLQKEDMKNLVLKELGVGNTYFLKSAKSDETERMKLVELSTHIAVFETKHGIKESFTYSELYRKIIGQGE